MADVVQFLDPPKKTGEPDGAVAPADKSSADTPGDRPALCGHRRKAS